MKRAFIIHGYGADPSSNWFPWVNEELKRKGFKSEVPLMPDTDYPVLGKWLDKMNEVVGDPDEKTFLIGHSLGVPTILKYLESLPKGKKVGGIILVSGFSEPLSIDLLREFVDPTVDYEKVKSCVKNKIIAIHSDNDPHIPLRCGKIFEDKLDAELIIIHNGEHLNTGDGTFRFPLVVEKILEVV